MKFKEPIDPKEDPKMLSLSDKDEDEDKEQTSAELRKLNKTRPAKTNPVPEEIISKYGGRIGDIWWHAKGRNGLDGDPTIGIEVDGVRKTFSGYVWEEWWYFQKTVHKSDNPDEPNQCYWYRKKKVQVTQDEYETLEEYVGVKLKDPDTGLPIRVPEELYHDAKDLCPDE